MNLAVVFSANSYTVVDLVPEIGVFGKGLDVMSMELPIGSAVDASISIPLIDCFSPGVIFGRVAQPVL